MFGCSILGLSWDILYEILNVFWWCMELHLVCLRVWGGASDVW